MTSEPVAGGILIVDDDQDFCETLADLLAYHGYHAACVADGQEALFYLRTQPLPKVVLLDWVTPGMSGDQFLREFLDDPRLQSLPVVIVTGLPSVRRVLPDPDVYPVLLKPFEVEDLLAVVGRYLEPSLR